MVCATPSNNIWLLYITMHDPTSCTPSTRWCFVFLRAGAIVYVEIGTLIPLSGSSYYFLREVYGDLVGFLYMFTWVVFLLPGGSALTNSNSISSVLARHCDVTNFRYCYRWSDVFRVRHRSLLQRRLWSCSRNDSQNLGRRHS